eukprot:NODE_91_length_21779_cov_0.171356.p6 type:complete len:362 gc:universal NODE_91_length_21779_cov_0.171356:14198-15283(+)
MLWSLSQVSALSTDCINVLAMGQSMKMATSQISQLKAANCCGVLGLTCDSKNHIDVIDWQGLSLNGTVSNNLMKLSITGFFVQNNNLHGSIPGFPKSIQYMSLENNHFSGKLPELPNAYEIYVGNNQFSGKLPEFPNTAMYFYAQNNRFSGQIPKLPTRLQYLDLQTNGFTGGLPTIPPNMVDLVLQNNGLKGKLPELPSSLVTLNIGSNSFFGSLPALPAELLEVNFYNNDFTGILPALPKGIRMINIYNNYFEGTLEVNKPVQLIANMNGLTGVSVLDQGQMSYCDVSNNPINRDTLAYLEGNCRLYGTIKPRPAALGKRSIDEEDVALIKREYTQNTADPSMLIIGFLLLLTTISSML